MADGWISTKTYRCGYVDKHINRWERGLDLDIDMLECPKCKSRVFARQYIEAVGCAGFSFCPYCGEDLREAQMSIFEKEESA